MAAQPKEQWQAEGDPYRRSRDISLYLFACRIHYLKYGDVRAYAELVSASRSTDPEVRTVACGLLADYIDQDNVLAGTERGSRPECQTCCS